MNQQRDRAAEIAGAARQASEKRAKGYREQSLKIHPWVCGRCGRSFTRENLSELTVHHKDHNHDNNPSDGSNWENLCIYCHDNEHSRHEEHGGSGAQEEEGEAATDSPFANLKAMMEGKNR